MATKRAASRRDKKIDQIGDALGSFEPGEMRSILAKDERIGIRVTPDEKEEIKGVASPLSLTVTEYLVTCHKIVQDMLKGRR